MARQHFRALFISDVHLGTPACRVHELLDFLDRVTADTIYLVGDIIDLERMRARPQFPPAHGHAIRRFIEIAQGPTRVVYIPGNHDIEFRRFAGQTVFGIEVLEDEIHETAGGERMLVFHGDVLDSSIRHGTNLERFAASAYAWLVSADVVQNQLRARFGGDFVPFATRIKMRLKRAQEYIRRFECTAARYAASRQVDGVICGHIHRPCVRKFAGITYANDGDWVEHRTAIGEDTSGNLVLLNYHPDNILVTAAPRPELAAA